LSPLRGAVPVPAGNSGYFTRHAVSLLLLLLLL
jgi:hypothetical protein